MMDDLMRARECLHLAESAEYLAAELGRPVKEHELLDLASAGKLKLAVLFERTGFARLVSANRTQQALSLMVDDSSTEPTTICDGVWDLVVLGTGWKVLRNQMNLRIARRDLLQPQGADGGSRLYIERDGALYRLLELTEPGSWRGWIDDPTAFVPAWHFPEGAALAVRPQELARFAAEMDAKREADEAAYSHAFGLYADNEDDLKLIEEFQRAAAPNVGDIVTRDDKISEARERITKRNGELADGEKQTKLPEACGAHEPAGQIEAMHKDQYRYVSKQTIVAVFAPIIWDTKWWRRKLSDKRCHLAKNCDHTLGRKGRGGASQWNPLDVARWVLGQDDSVLREINLAFRRGPMLTAWRNEWVDHYEVCYENP